jgi:3-oxoacyl-[acyl-carrier-protein] synthase III
MIFNKNAEIAAVGAYLPEEKLTNDDLSKIVETNDEWIYSRTGIKERRISKKTEFSSDMAIKAVQNLLDNNAVSVDDVDMIMVSTITQDYYTPSVAALVQSYFNISSTGSLDFNAACSGYVYGMQMAFSLIASGQYRKVLLITADTLSKIVDYTDRTTCVLFGDAATATIIQRKDDLTDSVYSFSGTDGTIGKELYCSNISEYIKGEEIKSKHVLNQNGRALYAYVTRDISEIVVNFLKQNNIGQDSINWFVPHSANERMITKLCEHIGIPDEKSLLSIRTCGNTSSNSIPLALWLAMKDGKIKRGDRMFLLGFGGGFTYAGLIFDF